ncbi:MAG: putative phosphoserine phosphatase / 1-acylglycerol-3-phosphate O-acyltransferase, partial [Mycobacterium sp.]|nr:putative phosphoserine phosphatase / 1-acylglycerol-3-phosphate O-acyltransferase [Mycobacterium sp.]
LPDRIAEVRQLYVDTLAEWPVDELPNAGVYRREKKAAPRKAPRKAASQPAKAAPAKAAAKKAAKKAQPKTSAAKATKAQKSTPRPRGRS